MSISDYDRERGVTSPNTGSRALEDEESDTKKVELVDITQKERSYGDRPLITITNKLHQSKDTSEKYHEWALILRRRVDKDGESLSTALEIRSALIRSAIRTVLADYPHVNLVGCPIKFQKPYSELFHYRQELRAFAGAPERSAAESKHLKLLLDFMQDNLGVTEKSYNNLVPNGMISFSFIWTIFRPDDVVILQRDLFKQCYVVVSGEEKMKDGEVYFQILAWSWDYNGTKFGPTLKKLRIKEFSGVRQISQLEVYPIRLLETKARDSLISAYVARGYKWRSIVNNSHRQYNGIAWTDPLASEAESIEDLVPTHISGRIILDCKSHQQANYKLATSLYGAGATTKREATDTFTDFLENIKHDIEVKMANGRMTTLNQMRHYPNEDYQMTDEQALLCPARIKGFSLTEKKWALFLVEEVEMIQWSTNAFDKLEMDPTAKNTIRALVQTHESSENTFDDFIVGKGKGLILLLHGPPGSGKTLTAESIAEHTQKPLLVIGSGELGTDTKFTEIQLRATFNFAKSWGAILLLDEADVFLAKRTKEDMVRNAFVSIFLRLLEYYEGILFLTTNRAREFDSAFESRIHLKVQYKALDGRQRTAIWRNLLEPIKSTRTWSQDVFERLGTEFKINGREIKNLIRTALAISCDSTEALTEDILRTVYRFNQKSVIEDFD